MYEILSIFVLALLLFSVTASIIVFLFMAGRRKLEEPYFNTLRSEICELLRGKECVSLPQVVAAIRHEFHSEVRQSKLLETVEGMANDGLIRRTADTSEYPIDDWDLWVIALPEAKAA